MWLEPWKLPFRETPLGGTVPSSLVIDSFNCPPVRGILQHLIGICKRDFITQSIKCIGSPSPFKVTKPEQVLHWRKLITMSLTETVINNLIQTWVVDFLSFSRLPRTRREDGTILSIKSIFKKEGIFLELITIITKHHRQLHSKWCVYHPLRGNWKRAYPIFPSHKSIIEGVRST